MNEMLRVEFHCHTIYSKDSLTRPEVLLAACHKRKIDRIVITDHNTISGARAAQKLDPERVIIGEEIMTRQGELLAAFVQEEIPSGLSSHETISLLRQQGAFISVSHPFDRFRSGHWELADLLEIIPLVDALETFNARCLWPGFNRAAQEVAQQHQIPGTVGSDAHAPFEIGQVVLLLSEFHNAEELKVSILNAHKQGSLSAPWVHLTSRYAVWKKKNTSHHPTSGESGPSAPPNRNIFP